MHKEIPYSKIIKLAILTAPLFGLFGATPVFVFTQMDYSFIITRSFLVVTALSLVFWIVNTFLVWLHKRFWINANDWFRYLFSILVCLLLMYLIADHVLEALRPKMPFELPREMMRNFPGMEQLQPSNEFLFPLLQFGSINIIIIILMELLFLRERKKKIETENTELRVANLEAKHSLLKQQLHPHFLFNSLSTLRSLIKRSPEQAEEYLLKLSELLRFSTANNFQSLVTLQEEVELCLNYLNMQKVRFDKALTFHVAIPIEMQKNGKVPVYSIQLLVENALKHNVLTVANPLNISILGNEKDKNITVTNNLQKKTNLEEGSGVGLSNLTERYQLLIDKGINIIESKSEFNVTIKVLDYENSNS